VATVVGLVLAGVAGAVSGRPGFVGALIGLAVVVLTLAFGSVIVRAVTSAAPSASLLVALLTYTLTVLALALVFVALTRSVTMGEIVHREWVGGSLIACTLTWTVAAVVCSFRVRQPVYDLPAPSESPVGVDDEEANVR
jgi:ATP synthase protein I